MQESHEEQRTTKFPLLKELLALTDDEQKLLNTFTAQITAATLNNNWDPVHKAITAESTEEWSLILIKIAENYKAMGDVCKSPILHEYWLNHWRKIQNPANNYQMQEQPLINHFDLYRGYYFYLLAIDAFDNGHNAMSQGVIEYLSKGQSYDSFHATCQLNGYFLNAIRETATQDGIDFSAVLQSLHQLAKLHLTPGYFLLARTHFELAQFDKRFADNENKQAIASNYSLALRYFYMAEQLVPYSQQSIANACLGTDFIKYFNLENLGWPGYKELIIEQAGNRLNSEAIYQEADSLLDQLIERSHRSGPQS